MAETMEQYMSKTRADCGSGVARPKIKNKDNFEPKGQFLKELRTNTVSGSDHEDANEHIEKVLEIVDLFHIPNITINQVILRALPMSLARAIVADAKIPIQEMAEYSQKWHNRASKSRSTETFDELAAIQAQLNNLRRDIKKVNEKSMLLKSGVNNAKDPITPKISHSKKKGRPLRKLTTCNLVDLFKEGDIKQQLWDSIKKQCESFVPRMKEIYGRHPEQIHEGFGSLPSSTKANPRDQVNSISTTIGADSCPIRHIGSAQYAVSTGQNRTLIWLRKNQGDDLMPTIKEGKVIEEFKTRDDELNDGIDDYPSYCDYDKKIHIDFLEYMDNYRDEGMGDVIFGKPFLRNVGVKTRRSEGMITIYNGNNDVSDEDKMNGISHPYQKLKGFYQGVLNLGPDYIRDVRMEEWLTRGHISMHDME
nr:hypothetical protein [Tanacetum cinerariifolium]